MQQHRRSIRVNQSCRFMSRVNPLMIHVKIFLHDIIIFCIAIFLEVVKISENAAPTRDGQAVYDQERIGR